MSTRHGRWVNCVQVRASAACKFEFWTLQRMAAAWRPTPLACNAQLEAIQHQMRPQQPRAAEPQHNQVDSCMHQDSEPIPTVPVQQQLGNSPFSDASMMNKSSFVLGPGVGRIPRS